jgi:hypothetical protein
VSKYRITVLTILARISPLPALSSSAISRARETRDVSGMRWCRSACCAETSRSHSRAMAEARCGLWWGMVRISFVGRRRGRLSRWTCRPSIQTNMLVNCDL